MLQLVLDVLRADMQMIDDYEFRSEPPLDCPIAVVGGKEDATADPAKLSAWSEHTRATFHSKVRRSLAPPTDQYASGAVLAFVTMLG